MAIALLNPNSTAAMTERMVETARVACPGAEITGWTSSGGPPAIQGPEDGLACIPPLFELLDAVKPTQPEAIVIGCSDDTGLDAIKAAMPCPVIGIGQAGYHLAAMAGARFSVVTTLQPSVAILDANIRSYGLGHQLVHVHASGVPVLDLDHDLAGATVRVLETIAQARRDDNVQSIVLGCAGMSHIARHAPDMGVRLIDGVAAAARIAVALTAKTQAAR